MKLATWTNLMTGDETWIGSQLISTPSIITHPAHGKLWPHHPPIYVPYSFPGAGGGGYIQKKMGRGVRKASWNPYPISDQNLWFSLPYFRPDQKGNVYTLLSTVHIPNSRLLSTVHIPNSRLECTNHTLFQTKMVKIDTLFRTKTGKKTMPFRAAHTYIAYVTEYITPPPSLPRAHY